jgi:hypothetical protein
LGQPVANLIARHTVPEVITALPAKILPHFQQVGAHAQLAAVASIGYVAVQLNLARQFRHQIFAPRVLYHLLHLPLPSQGFTHLIFLVKYSGLRKKLPRVAVSANWKKHFLDTGESNLALRIKARWHDEDAERSLDEIAGAIAFNAWRIAKDKAINLHGEDFVYEDDEQRFSVIQEYLIFQLQLVDRIAHTRLELDEDSRKSLVLTTAKNMAKHLHDNSVDVFGAGSYVQPFVERINQRGTEYAEFNFTDDGPSYPFMRHLGFEMQQIMGTQGENRWVIDQVMDKDGPDVYRQLSRALDSLFE